MSEEVDFSKKSMRSLHPMKPEQHNYSDGGIYLLHYVEKIFNSVAQFYWPEIINTLNDDWFPLKEVLEQDLKRNIFYIVPPGGFQEECHCSVDQNSE